MVVKRVVGIVCALGIVAGASAIPVAQQPAAGGHPDIRLFFMAIAQDDDQTEAALNQIAASWRDGYAGMIWDLARRMAPPRPADVRLPSLGGDPTDPGAGRLQLDIPPQEHPTTKVWRRLMDFLEQQTDQRFRGDLLRVHQWIWDQPYDPHAEYAFFKGVWYSQIAPAFGEFFPAGTQSTIRLDEVDWGGVSVNGIPPLEYPASIAASEADYLEDDHIVFGIAVNGEARAYPRRILAWHEMALDRLGGVELTIVYCTLCGTVIPYESMVGGEHIRFGTSGLLYRSNKLMFDYGTKSLWNTFEGVPVVGPLVGSGVRLMHRSVVTTTWGAWRSRHPDTSVLSVETGHERDYAEGAAYRDYFSTDRLMFDVPSLDDRLKNKDEVVVMLLEDVNGMRQPLAMAADFLRGNRLYHLEHAGHQLVVVTSEAGANRVYETRGTRFARENGEGPLVDESGRMWRVREDALVSAAGPDQRLPRVAAQRAFWFGWHAQFPETALIK